MRVITGTAKGTKLIAVKGMHTRPTTDKVKEAIFSILSTRVLVDKVLDLFAGTGALGIEALSRGALSCVFVDNDRNSISVIKTNLEKTKLLNKGTVVQKDVFAYLDACKDKYDLVFMDPPYDKNFIQKSLSMLDINDIINEKGVIVCESSADDIIEDRYHHFQIYREYLYGGTKITVFYAKG
ncbi:MAG: 16S rRNA (guanine(966)-N(2))-methyltransferase RsmD [Clostridia bacterium]|jgi:16S rRNA (guanine966-N2)-methyltransferase|nr:16S rRNA (guanine(966)-N(2))-methyltransferase RsmD [Clostridiaceae bacterium]